MHGDPACFAAAVRRRAFGRALRIGTAVDPAPVGDYVASIAKQPTQHGMTSTNPFPKAD
ncbi:MAG: hypothetical protein JWN61_241 [Pseudonocardiales bacterium]|nr:hypothetical protein [Jatrophihabitantaceae bacterium]MCW2602106.1 hypothetical protein [Pseudonocardiales bacterium]